jgi:hypothetical protein
MAVITTLMASPIFDRLVGPESAARTESREATLTST